MKIDSKQTYIIIAVVIVASIGGYTYWQNSQKTSHTEERYQRWVDWSRTLYVGSTSGTFHPGLNLDTQWLGYFSRMLRGGKMVWINPESGNIEDYSPYVAESWEYKENATTNSHRIPDRSPR